MIAGGSFVWLHFPKCGGHTVEQALRVALKHDGQVHFDRAHSAGWHDSLRDRLRRGSEALSGRTVVCGFRRLPYWMLSRVHYEAARAPYHSVTREMLCRGEYFEQNGQINTADNVAAHYAQSAVDRWIRIENLVDDFIAAFEDLIDSDAARAAVRRLRRVVNATQLNYIRDLEFYFTPEELAGLYAANPVWAAREEALYGDLLTLRPRSLEARYFVDQKLNFISASPTALETWGKSVGDVIGRHILDVFPKSRGSEPYLAHVQALRTRRSRRLHTRSPTYGKPAVLELEPKRAGLQVTFEMHAEA